MMSSAKIFFCILTMFAISFSAQAQTCRELFHVNRLANLSDNGVMVHGLGKLNVTHAAEAATWFRRAQIKTKLSFEPSRDEQLETKSYAKLQEYLERLAKRGSPLNVKQLNALVDYLYSAINESGDEQLALSGLSADNKSAKALHETILKQIMYKDLRSALLNIGFREPNQNWIRDFLKKSLGSSNVNFWVAVHLPLALLFHEYYPLWLPNPKMKISDQTESLVRQNLVDGDFNGALKAIEPELKKTYGTRIKFDKGFRLTRRIYAALSMVVLANCLMSSQVALHYVPGAAETYKELTIPVINEVQRITSDRSQLEKIVLEAVIQTKEEDFAHKIALGSPEYVKSEQHVRQLTYEELQILDKSLKHE